MRRREFLKNSSVLAGGLMAAGQLKSMAQAQAVAATSSGSAVVVDPKPRFEMPPHLYMQFMEPLGATDSSVDAAWDYNRDDWRKDFLEARFLAGLSRRDRASGEKSAINHLMGAIEQRPRQASDRPLRLTPGQSVSRFEWRHRAHRERQRSRETPARRRSRSEPSAASGRLVRSASWRRRGSRG